MGGCIRRVILSKYLKALQSEALVSRFSLSAISFQDEKADKGGGGKDDKTEGILDRLRRLSVTPADQYTPSQGAQKVREEADAKHAARGGQRDGDFDQRRFRPNQPPNYRQNYRDYDRGADRGGGGYNNREDRGGYQDRSRRDTESSRYSNASRDSKPKLTPKPPTNKPHFLNNSSDSHISTAPLVEDAEIDLSILSKTDADTFGTLSLGAVPITDNVGASRKKELMKDERELGMSALDDFEEDDFKFLPIEGRWSMDRLELKIKELVAQMKVKEAVDTLMSALKEGGFQFDPKRFQYIYNLCIATCGQVGYVKMSFKLFNDMKKRGFYPRDSTYTSLFNACSNSTWDSENNIERMNRLRETMLEKGIPPNQIIYHAMIKGYGRNGDIESAFGVVDEMLKSGGQISPNTETFNMLLQACISNTQNGFRHVLVTWRKMEEMRIQPDIYAFNLLLRAIRECGILPDDSLIQLERLEQRNNKEEELKDAEQLILLPVVSEEENNEMLNLLCLNNQASLPKINRDGQQMTYKRLIEALQVPSNRLAVFGGLRGFMAQMAGDKVGPNLKTVTELGQSIPASDIGDLIMMMNTYKLKPDITFFNLMIKRYYDGGNVAGAKKLTAAMGQFGLSPDILTWGVSASGCRNQTMAERLLAEMDQAKFVPNIQIMGGMLGQATREFDAHYVTWAMDETLKREVEPEVKFVLQIEEFKHLVKKGIINKELGKPVQPPRLEAALKDMQEFEKGWKKFLFRYESWMKNTKIQIEPKDPWEKDFETFRKNRTHGTLQPSNDYAITTPTSEESDKSVDAKTS